MIPLPSRFARLVRLLVLAVVVFAPVAAAQSATSKLQEGASLIQSGDLEGAAAVFRAVVDDDEDNARGWYLLGHCLHNLGQLEEAVAAHERAAGFDLTASGASYNAACAHALLGDADAALGWLARARDAGFADRGLMQTDSDLASVRSDPRFADLLPPLLSGSELFVESPRLLLSLDGEAAGDQFGWVARRVGDVDGDGAQDFVTSAPTKVIGGVACGRIYVYSSAKGELLFTRDGQPGEMLGMGLAPAGDVNGDDVPDVLAGAPRQDGGPGKAYVLSGVDGEVLLVLSANEPGDSFGQKLCGAGDLDGDGHDDVLIGAMLSDVAGLNSGKVYAYGGADGGLLFEIDGEAAGHQFGSAIDATRTGGHLIVVGAMGAGPSGGGRAYVYRYVDGRAEAFFTIEPDATAANLGQYFVSILGDVDGDGVADVYASDFANAARGNHSGRVYVHSGSDGNHLLTLTGQPGEGFGTSPSQAGDVNGDGHADLIVGAWQNAEQAPSAGKVYLHSGQDGALLSTFTCRQGGDTFGFDAQGLGDVDGDGGIDFLLTSAWSAVRGPQTGRVFIVAGSPPEAFEDA